MDTIKKLLGKIPNDMKSCARCSNLFMPTNNKNLYCVQCKYKHMAEAHRKYMKKSQERSKYVYNPKDMERVMEVRAEYISDFFVRTGILLQW